MCTQILTYKPAALLKPTSDIVPHVVRLKRVEQEIGGFNQFCRLLVLSKFTNKESKISTHNLYSD